VVLAFLAPACRQGPPPSISEAVASSVPAGTIALAGIDLAALHRSNLYPRIPRAARSFLEAPGGASHLFFAWNGKTVLTLAEGSFSAAPPGFTLISRHVAAAGSADALRAAEAQRKTGRTGAPDLLAHAANLAANDTVWVVAAGDANLPFSGNLANLARLLRYTRYTTAAARIDDRITLQAGGLCAGPAQARELEEKLRALVSFFSAAASRRPGLAQIWSSLRIAANGDTVRVSLALSPEASETTITLLAP
jgi:hypothetical protein